MFSGQFDSPIGTLTVVVADTGVRAVFWAVDGEDRRVPAAAGAVPRADHPLVARTIAQLGEYFAGTRRSFDLMLDPIGTEFQQAAWEALRAIPYGTTVDYATQASMMGQPKAIRAVGTANGRNPLGVIVPCHRVVGKDGSLAGFAGGLDAKQWLLDHERAVAARS